MNFKVAFFLFFIGASSASFLGNINTHVVAKKATAERISSPFRLVKHTNKSVAKGPIEDLLAILTQILGELEIFGEIVSETLVEDLQNFLADLIAIESDVLDQIIVILEQFAGQLPQELVDILIELGLLPTPKNISKGPIEDLLAILTQILGELEIFGEIVTDTLLQDLEAFLADLIAIESDLIDQVLVILQQYVDQLPQEIVDILVELGLLPPPKTLEVKATIVIKTLKTALLQKDIWQEVVDQLMIQLVQIIEDLDTWGIQVSDEVLAQIEDLILAVMAQGGQAWDTLLALLEEYSFELNEVLGELLAELGIVPKKVSSLIQKDLIDDILNALTQILAELEIAGGIISDELVDLFTDLVLQLEEVGGVGFDLILALLTEYAELLYEQFGDLLEQLGITIPPLPTQAVRAF